MAQVRNPFIRNHPSTLMHGQSNTLGADNHDREVPQTEYTSDADGIFTVPDDVAADLLARGDWEKVGDS